MVNYFYTFHGIFLFLCLTLMLFIMLLLVTSQYVAPSGPFRSTMK